ncbi:hypothetical protein VT06_13080 [Arsukibacterium sp. MJ3]|uniref:GNAT family N-acetyltransferase n=1 Tax=Arsukibacterium sp. MJ3 TaxID=1632859 RepID=UPI0006270A1C|nr:GNAT family N-acetyltransferase [Arsukibacterium sp. MJ3]KKO48170.1 hypothetical protein VT06_13080 [Arsukibacterium sp. MJ3]
MRSLIVLRMATLADADKLLLWRNDDLTRTCSLNSEPVTLQQHLAWLQSSFENKQRHLFIAEFNGDAIGTVRVDSKDDRHTISWTVGTDFREKGLAKLMVALLVSKLDGIVVAEILPGNAASIRVAESAGLTYVNTHNGIMYYEYQAPG